MNHIPILIAVPSGLTCPEVDVAEWLERGADGVHSCEEGLRLLAARIEAYLWRNGVRATRRGQWRVGSVELDADLREVRIAGQSASLSAKPFRLLEVFMREPSKVFSRSELTRLLWGADFAIGGHALDVHIHAIRRQLDRDPLRRCRLLTIKGVGFKLKADSSAVSLTGGATRVPTSFAHTGRGIAATVSGWRKQGSRPIIGTTRRVDAYVRPGALRKKRVPLYRETSGRSHEKLAG